MWGFDEDIELEYLWKEKILWDRESLFGNG